MKKSLLTLALLTSLSYNLSFAHATSIVTDTQVTAVKVKQEEQVQRVLWGIKKSPYVRKVIITFEEKNIPYELKEILPTKLLKATNQEVPADFSKISPAGKIPAYQETFKDKDFSLTESSVIAEYIDKSSDTNPLRPNCPKADARVSWFIKYGDDTLAPITHKILVEKIVKPNILKETSDAQTINKMLQTELPIVLDFLEETLADKRTWIADTKNFSLADITIVSHLVTLTTSDLNLEEVIGEKRPNLLAYVKKVLDRKSFKTALI